MGYEEDRVAVVTEMQLRLVYSLLKPAVRMAGRFHLPVKALTELVRLAYYEQLTREGLTTAAIAERFGQTPRHLRSLAQRLNSDFFAAERAVGLVREVEALIATESTEERVIEKLPAWEPAEIRRAIRVLVDEERVEQAADGRLLPARRYVVFASEKFVHRIDALNHFLDGVYHAVVQRLILDDQETSMMKTMSFAAIRGQLTSFREWISGSLRRELGELDEAASFQGQGDQRYTLAVLVAPVQREGGHHED